MALQLYEQDGTVTSLGLARQGFAWYGYIHASSKLPISCMSRRGEDPVLDLLQAALRELAVKDLTMVLLTCW